MKVSEFLNFLTSTLIQHPEWIDKELQFDTPNGWGLDLHKIFSMEEPTEDGGTVPVVIIEVMYPDGYEDEEDLEDEDVDDGYYVQY